MKKIPSISMVFGDAFYKKHWLVFKLAKKHNLALCGSMASALCRNRTDYVPNDIDFVCGSKEELAAFINDINLSMVGRDCHYRVMVNSHNDFCPKPSEAHARITCSFWIPICVFLIPAEKFYFFRAKGGTLVQRLTDVQDAAKELQETDKKPRLASETIDWDEVSPSSDPIPYQKPQI